MMISYFTVTLAIILSLSFTAWIAECASETSDSKKPKYMDIFSSHQHWEGTYIYNSSMHYCYMYAHSEHYLKKDVLLVTFRDKTGVTIELEGVSPGQDDLEVKFTVHVMFHHDNRFPVNFTLLGPLTQKPSDTWCYNAEITPKRKFGSFALCTSGSDFGPSPTHDDGSGWKYFAIIGVPVILAVIGVSGTVAIIYWAIKKGYIRHVPKSYDTFNNPVQFENNESQEGNVHI